QPYGVAPPRGYDRREAEGQAEAPASVRPSRRAECGPHPRQRELYATSRSLRTGSGGRRGWASRWPFVHDIARIARSRKSKPNSHRRWCGRTTPRALRSWIGFAKTESERAARVGDRRG